MIQMTEQDRTEIIEKIEDDEIIAKTVGHELYCYEVNVEILCERLAERGIDNQGGRHDEVIDGMTILEHIQADILEGKYRCECDGE